MERIQEACRLNNIGAMHLSCQDAGTAVKAFKTALAIMEEVASDESSANLCCQSQDMMPATAGCPSVVVPGLEDDFFIYNRALLLDASIVNSAANIDLPFANAIILFNLALTFQQRGKACGDTAKLQKAVYLYQVASKLITNMASTCSGALALAALNNRAQILYSMGEYAQARSLLDEMSSLVKIVPSPVDDGHGNANSTFARYHFDEFFLNATTAQAPTAAPSA